jgi:predicted SAM-dependent methyltransferase
LVVAAIRADEFASRDVRITVVWPGPAAGGLQRPEQSDPSTQYLSAADTGSVAEAWSLGVEATTAPWVLLVSGDVRPEPGWLAQLVRHVGENPECVAAAPSVHSEAGVGTTAAPAAGRGVCLMVSRTALAEGTIRHIDQVPQAHVALTAQEDSTQLTPSSPETEPTVHSSQGAPAPGGGAPPGQAVWIDNTTHAGAAFPDMKRRIHLGCGKNRIPGWLNVDGDAAGAPDMVVDLNNGIPLPDDSVELIYSEHLFEHCTLAQGMLLFAECCRLLAAGGVIRTAMPNLRDTVTYYLENWREQSWLKDFPQIDSPARMLNTCLREWGHLYVYDDEELSLRLRQSGFVGIEAAKIGESRHAALRNLETRPESTLIFEATKP